MIVSFSIFCFITSIIVVQFLLETSTRKHSLVSLQIPPKIHCSGSNLPTLFLRFMKRISSISTILPGTAIFYVLLFTVYLHTFLSCNCSNQLLQLFPTCEARKTVANGPCSCFQNVIFEYKPKKSNRCQK